MKEHNYEQATREKLTKSWLRSYAIQSWWQIAIVLLLSILMVGLELILPWPLKLLSDSVFGEYAAPGPLAPYSQSVTLLYIIAGIYIAAYSLRSIIGILNGYLGTRFGYSIDLKVKKQLFDHILKTPIRSPKRLKNGDYVYRQNEETDTISNLILNNYVTVFKSVLMVLGVLVILLNLNWQLTLISLAVVPLMYVSLQIFGPRIERQATSIEEITSKLYSLTQESIENADIVQMFNRQDYQAFLLYKLLTDKLHAQIRYTLLLGIFGFVTSILTVLSVVSIVIIGGQAVFNGNITFGDLLLFVMYSSYLYEPLENIAGAVGSMRQNLASIKRVHSVIEDTSELENNEGSEILEVAKGRIDFKNVTFNYGKKRVLDDVSFSINPGEKVGFIGPSGAGKSTVLALIMRFVIPEKGFIFLDGKELRTVTLSSLRKQIAVVEQEPKLFSGSISENIGFAEPQEEYPLPRIMAAATSAHANEFINQLPDKYDESVQALGDSLSGGQKQRIAIARAIYKRAPILILDEPTSAQDVSNESQVLDAIDKLIVNKTAVMVTHKHSLLSKMDTVYVVEAGKIKNVAEYGGLDAYTRYLHVHDNERQ